MYVIGTAGHIDHGKSALVQALTGIDPDRLREEKERGMTIDLGFAWMTLPSGRDISIVDVPGHERFIRNMLAGAGGIDLALLVVAADEGVMPQTREHLAILDLLDIRRGVLVVTKRDLVDDDWLELVSADVLSTAAGTTLDGSPLVACSAASGDGLETLKRVIDEQLEHTAPKRDIGRPRLPIDRAFTIAGFGTVVTGTLIDGSLEVGQEIEIYPTGQRARIRGLQSHRMKVDRLGPGNRCAANLSGVAVDDVRRGMVVARPGSLQSTMAVDVRLRAIRSLDHPLRHGLRLSFHSGADESQATLRLLDSDSLDTGEEAWGQLKLDTPVTVVKGDYFVLRTPDDTVAGGVVLDTRARRHRRRHEPTLRGLEALLAGSSEEIALEILAKIEPAGAPAIARASDLSSEAASAALVALVADGRAIAIGQKGESYTRAGFERLGARVAAVLDAGHREHPLRPGIAPEEIRSRLNLDARSLASLLAALGAEGVIEEERGLVRRPGFRPLLADEQRAQADRFLARLRASPHSPPSDGIPDPELLAYLEYVGSITRAGEGVVFAAEAYREIEARIVEAIRKEGSITLARARDLFGTSRRYAQAILEYMDERRITVRTGDERVLRGGR